MEGPRMLYPFGASFETLRKLKIVHHSHLQLKSFDQRLQKSRLLGKNELWSSDHFYEHLLFLEGHVRKVPTGKHCRLWNQAFISRVCSMLARDKDTVFSRDENSSPEAGSPGGGSPDASSSLTASTPLYLTDYVVVVTTHKQADAYRKDPQIPTARLFGTGLFITEAKSGWIEDNILQAVCQLYNTGKYYGKDTIRGAVSNGNEWIFIILHLNKDNDGASFQTSSVVKYVVSNNEVDKPWPDLIAGILSSWGEKSFDSLDDNDWFEKAE
ncbi:hypothetical protein BDP27DRAFT_328388 [Rhodocollybia butyracea]|uniref:Uncharacterized protein n=1 Tax=Rhodocollybia butyracea TaxID=206335 RepID=A0A9P5PF54_9AGAR|nr:hypothetical protein BDP27DRAFT_328388 [Rhodocollybia butyracea]